MRKFFRSAANEDELHCYHPSNATFSADVCGNSLKCHNGASSGFFCDTRLYHMK